jgi:hypothetical protein
VTLRDINQHVVQARLPHHNCLLFTIRNLHGQQIQLDF